MTDLKPDEPLIVCVEEETPQIDYRKLNYPSDALTVKHLRTFAEPEYKNPFDDRDYRQDMGHSFRDAPVFGELETLIGIERDMAQAKFNETLELPHGMEKDCFHYGESRENLAEMLILFGVADGVQSAEQKIQRFEQEVVQQAREHSGKPIT